MKIRLPNVFIAGFQKCATTSIFESIITHPEIAGPSRSTGVGSDAIPKEVHFFNLRFHLGLDWYGGLYENSAEHHLVDGSPIYLCAAETLQRLAETVEEPLFVVSMRDPVARVMSAWNHWTQLGEEERWLIPNPEGSLLENLEAEWKWLDPRNPGDGFLGTGLYAAHLARAFEFFPREYFHFTFLEWLEDAYQSEIQRIFQFLHVPARSAPVLRSHSRERRTGFFDEELLLHLQSFYREDRACLSEILGFDPPW